MMHFMLDCETFGLRPGHAVTQIAVLEFDPHSPLEFGRAFQGWINLQDDAKFDPKTVEWWMSQNPVAQRRMLGRKEDRKLAFEVRGDLFSFWNSAIMGPMTPVWAHGAAFDFGMVQAALAGPRGYDSMPWHYRAIRDTRTLFDLVGGAPEPLVRGVEHDALDDCKAQATQIQQAFLQLRNLLPELSDQSAAPPAAGTPLALFAEAVGAPVSQ